MTTIVISGGVEPVLVRIPEKHPSPAEILSALAKKVGCAQPGDPLSFSELELGALATGLLDLIKKTKREEEIREILRGGVR